MKRSEEIDIAQYSLFDDNSHVKERVKKRDSQKRKKECYESTAKFRSKDKTPDQIRNEFQERTGKSHPQEAWSRDFYLKNKS